MFTVRAMLALAAVSGLAIAQTEDAVKGVYQRIKVHGKSLEGNLSGDTPFRPSSRR
jgi:hypothetical protein